MWAFDLGSGFRIINCLFGVFKGNKNADPDRYGYSGYDIGFHACFFFFLLQRGNGFSKNFHIFGFSLSSVHCDNVWQID